MLSAAYNGVSEASSSRMWCFIVECAIPDISETRNAFTRRAHCTTTTTTATTTTTNNNNNNKPDIIIRDNEKGTCMLIDVAISGDRNVIKKEAEKILKYMYLTIEIQLMWNG